MTDFQVFEDFSLELCGAAAEVAVPIFRAGCGHEDKGAAAGFDPVTEADKGAEASIAMHENFGFKEIGHMGKVGFKFDRWLGTVLMQKSLK